MCWIQRENYHCTDCRRYYTWKYVTDVTACDSWVSLAECEVGEEFNPDNPLVEETDEECGRCEECEERRRRS